MRRLLPLLCLAATLPLAPRALADRIDDFALYNYAGPVDDQPGWHDGVIPPTYSTLTTFSLPATPTGPLPVVYPFPGSGPLVYGFEIDNVAALSNGVPITLPYLEFLADFQGGGLLVGGFTGGHSGMLYTLSGDNVPTFTPTDAGGAILFQQGVPVAILTITPEPDTSPVPEPATLTLLATGALGLATAVRSRPGAPS